MRDLYFDEKYGRLYEKIENGTCELFHFRHPLGSIRHMFIKRRIPLKVNGNTYFDIVTPYSYGGPLIEDCTSEGKEELVKEFMQEFQAYCTEHRIISEFIRFQPVIGVGMSFVYDNMIHTHLSGTLNDFQHLPPSYILQYSLVEWGKKNGIDPIHDGGGRTNSPNDKLYLFKKQFGRTTRFKFHTGKKIWNAPIYEELCKEVNVDIDEEFFPAYRSAMVQETENAYSD